jgi:hypothetical protein
MATLSKYTMVYVRCTDKNGIGPKVPHDVFRITGHPLETAHADGPARCDPQEKHNGVQAHQAFALATVQRSVEREETVFATRRITSCKEVLNRALISPI